MVHFSYNLFIFHICSSSKPESVGSILALNHKFFNASKSTGETKGSPLWVFFRHYATFVENFRILSKGTPLHFLKFSVCWRKPWMSLNDLFLGFSALCDFFTRYFFWKKIIFFQIFPIVVPWMFSSLRYGADLGRSRLVFSSDYNPHTDRSTFLTILKSYNSYLANLKY